jgi:hypothetical protein
MEAIDLMHPLVQDRHDADVAVAKPPPVDEVPLVSEKVTFDAELRRHGFRRHAVGLDLPEGVEQSLDLAVRRT